MKNDKESKLNVLLAEYNTVSQETILYLKESMRCFLYGAILIGVYLNSSYTDSEIIKKIADYVPYGITILILYFASINYYKITVGKYRVLLEKKINKLLDDDTLMLFNSYFTEQVTSKGFLQIKKGGRKWPTPIIYMVTLIFLAIISLFVNVEFIKIPILKYILFIISIIVAVYSFLIYPKKLHKFTLELVNDDHIPNSE